MNPVNKAREFIYRNARSLDLALWQYHFESGNQEAVLKALSYYQNEDGGFGHALEPDLWNSQSSPFATSKAIKLLTSIDFFDSSHEIVRGILVYLENTPFQIEKGWLLKIPSNNDYPHAPWWEYSQKKELHSDWEYNPTAILAGFILKMANRSSKLYSKASRIVKAAIIRVEQNNQLERHEIACYCSLLSFLEKAAIKKEEFDRETLSIKLQSFSASIKIGTVKRGELRYTKRNLKETSQ